MHDLMPTAPDHRCLFAAASEQHGYFTASQARDCGLSWELLTKATRRGRFIRMRRGLYRLRDYPSVPREDVMAAWLAVGKDAAVVSHESALDLLGLSDVIPSSVHLTVPRARRYLAPLPGVTIHTTTHPIGSADAIVRDGIRLTSVERTIFDAAETGTAPEQIERAVRQALQRGLVDGKGLKRDAEGRSRRVQRLIQDALSSPAP